MVLIGVVELLIGVVGLGQGARLWLRAGHPDPDPWMGIDLSKPLVARLYGSVFLVFGIAAIILAFVAPGSGR